MNIKNIVGASILSGAALLNNSCKSTETQYTGNWIKSNRTELHSNIMKNRLQSPLKVSDNKNIADIQHEIDCIVFQDMLAGTQMANNSEFVSDYNAMLKETQAEQKYFNKVNTKVIDKKLKKVLTGQEVESLNRSMTKNKCAEFVQVSKQYLVDSVYHHKLFKKYGLLEGNKAKEFQALCKKIKP